MELPLINRMEFQINEMVDDLQGLCSSYGLANQASEETIITNVFLYKFLNDKFMYDLKQFSKEINEDSKEILKNENDELDAFYDKYSSDVVLGYQDTIEYLANHASQENFATLVQDALNRISDNKRNERFKIETASGDKGKKDNKKKLFGSITEGVEDDKKMSS